MSCHERNELECWSLSSHLLGTLNRPEKNIIVYEYEASPFCRKVRDACAVLDLSVELRPCPGARFGWSDYQAELTGGKRTVPYMVDPNSKTSIFESDDIVNYLFNTCKIVKTKYTTTHPDQLSLVTFCPVRWPWSTSCSMDAERHLRNHHLRSGVASSRFCRLPTIYKQRWRHRHTTGFNPTKANHPLRLRGLSFCKARKGSIIEPRIES